jgi:DNA (cytosine-5)-methyltransferase 1
VLRVGSVFAGIGGLDLGAERGGLCVSWQIEIDAAARAVLGVHWPGVPCWTDVRTVDSAVLSPVEVLVGGFPCQDLSVAGKRAGLEGEKSGVVFEWLRLLDGLRPRWIVLENVPGLLSSHRGRDFLVLLDALGQRGYGVAWRILDAQYFGVAQQRRRVFIVGYLGDPARACQVLFEPAGVPGHPAPGGATGPRAPSLLASGAGTSRPAGIASEPEFLITQALTGGYGNGGPDDNKAQGGFVVADWAHPDVDHGASGPMSDVSLARTLAAHAPRYDSETETLIAQVSAAPSPATGPEDGKYEGVRRLTPLEAERLQGFPDGWTLWGSDVRTALVDYWTIHATAPEERHAVERLLAHAPHSSAATASLAAYLAQCIRSLRPRDRRAWRPRLRVLADAPRYRLLGNAVAVPVAAWLFQRLAHVDSRLARDDRPGCGEGDRGMPRVAAAGEA